MSNSSLFTSALGGRGAKVLIIVVDSARRADETGVASKQQRRCHDTRRAAPSFPTEATDAEPGLPCYSNTFESVSLRKCPRDHRLSNKAYLSSIAVTDVSRSFTHKTAAKINWHRYGTKLRHCHPTCRKTTLFQAVQNS